MPFRSLRSLATRTLAAGAASALALTMFNAAQPSLGGTHKISPGTLKDVQLTLSPVAGRAAGGGPRPGPGRCRPPGGRRPKCSRRAGGGVGAGGGGEGAVRGFSWPEQAAVGTVWLRARTAGGWSGWREVEEAADGPDATSREYRPGRAYSDGQWLDAGTAEIQVRVGPPAAKAGAGTQAVPSNGVEAHLITPDMAPTPGTEPARAGVATAATVQPRIISRAGWGADERIRRHSPEYSDTVKAAFVHHTVQSNSYSPLESAALIRADYLYHVRGRGWNDIGYNFLVDRYGRVFEGRYGGVTRAVLGAHAGGFNTNTTGVALLGTFTTARPTGPMLAGLERLLAWKLDLTHVDPTGLTVLTSAGGANVRHPAGRRVVARTILGHGSTSHTTCPGSPTLRLLSSIRSAVSRIGRPKIYGGSAATSRVRPERGGYAGVHARFSSSVRWRVVVTGSSGAAVRSFTGTGSEAKVRWNGRTSSGVLAPPGWATVTVTATAGGASARPVISRVFVDRIPPVAGSSTGGAAGAWRVSNANAEQLSTSAPVFASYRWGRSGDLPVVEDWDGDGTQTVGVVRPSAARDSNHLLLRNGDGSVLDFWYGRNGDRILVGDWNGDGTWTPGVLRAGTRWYLKDSLSGSAAAVGLAKQTPGTPVVGDWDNRP